ncbi:unnamed protein product [Fusarium venenatum]|uniref:Uncharacterized protein n=1 Tax=Fusarium venenatum TaxID=56646 RepID=A0A2L2TQQ2_9HYPO|nr:uncharacterized protein FVRRES_03869 [Fusarium venenatum]CEI67357.1 unnamed protein product [Fusarium venenatum]
MDLPKNLYKDVDCTRRWPGGNPSSRFAWNVSLSNPTKADRQEDNPKSDDVTQPTRGRTPTGSPRDTVLHRKCIIYFCISIDKKAHELCGVSIVVIQTSIGKPIPFLLMTKEHQFVHPRTLMRSISGLIRWVIKGKVGEDFTAKLNTYHHAKKDSATPDCR